MDGPAVQGVEQRHVARRHVGVAARRPVEGRGGAHQHRAHVLVPEIQLDLLEGPLDEKAGEGVHDGPQPGQRQPRRRPD
jgi:hypothetical protein